MAVRLGLRGRGVPALSPLCGWGLCQRLGGRGGREGRRKEQSAASGCQDAVAMATSISSSTKRAPPGGRGEKELIYRAQHSRAQQGCLPSGARSPQRRPPKSCRGSKKRNGPSPQNPVFPADSRPIKDSAAPPPRQESPEQVRRRTGAPRRGGERRGAAPRILVRGSRGLLGPDGAAQKAVGPAGDRPALSPATARSRCRPPSRPVAVQFCGLLSPGGGRWWQAGGRAGRQGDGDRTGTHAAKSVAPGRVPRLLRPSLGRALSPSPSRPAHLARLWGGAGRAALYGQRGRAGRAAGGAPRGAALWARLQGPARGGSSPAPCMARLLRRALRGGARAAVAP